MDMYVRMYDELKKAPDDNPTLGIVLCSETDEDIAKYSVLHGNEQLFASKYKLYLPTDEELRAEIETQKAMFYLQQQEKEQNQSRIRKIGEGDPVKNTDIVVGSRLLQNLRGVQLSNDLFADNALAEGSDLRIEATGRNG